MKQLRLYADSNGESHFEDIEVAMELSDFAPPAQALYRSAFEHTDQLVFLELPAGWGGLAHKSPAKQALFCLSGSMEVIASDGTKRTVEAGDVWRMEDTTGKGHKTTVTSKNSVYAAVVQLK